MVELPLKSGLEGTEGYSYGVGYGYCMPLMLHMDSENDVYHICRQCKDLQPQHRNGQFCSA